MFGDMLTDYMNMNKLFEDIFNSLLMGDFKNVYEIIKNAFLYELCNEVYVNKKLMISLLVLVIIGAILGNIQSGSTIKDSSFYVTYLVQLGIMISSYKVSLDIAYKGVEGILELMRGIIPVYALSLASCGYITTSAAIYEVLIIALGFTDSIILKVVFPLINMYVTLKLINSINTENRFLQMAELFKGSSEWILKSLIALIIGINMVKSLITPAFDSVKTMPLQKGISVLPGGQVVNALSSILVGSGVLIKNSIGVAGMIIKAVFTATVLFILTIAIVAVATTRT